MQESVKKESNGIKLIYGAGRYCREFLLDVGKDHDFQFIIDKNSELQGTRLYDVPIIGLDEAKHIKDSIEQIVITTRLMAVNSVADVLISELRIDKSALAFFKAENKEVLTYDRLRDEILEKKILWDFTEKTIVHDLLSESLDNGEFNGYKRLIVFGDKSEYRMIEAFFRDILSEQVIIHYEEQSYQEKASDLMIITGADYLETMTLLRKKQVDESRWLVLPLYDVSGTIM